MKRCSLAAKDLQVSDIQGKKMFSFFFFPLYQPANTCIAVPSVAEGHSEIGTEIVSIL